MSSRKPAAGMNQPHVVTLDEDALAAAADLAGRTGARQFEIGYLHDDVPAGQAAWYAAARYRGARITEDGHKGPVEAAEALARRLLAGGRCTSCGGVITLSGSGTMAAGVCRWTRIGRNWTAGCDRGQGAT